MKNQCQEITEEKRKYLLILCKKTKSCLMEHSVHGKQIQYILILKKIIN